MEIVNIRRSDKEGIYTLRLEESRIMRRYISRKVYHHQLTREVFEKSFRKQFGKDKCFKGIRENGRIVAMISGFIQRVQAGYVGYIDNIFVTKGYQGKGYATVLRDEFYTWLRQKGVRYCKLDVLAKNPAVNIYKKWGFTVDSYQMTKRLPP